jgi:integral membrane protein (TIGR01906 family)
MPGGQLGAFLVGVATALVILGGSILPFLTPAYVRFEQDRVGVALDNASPSDLDRVVASLLGDLLFWQGDFGATEGHTSLLNDREVAHMRDVRGVFAGFWLLVLASVAVLVLAFRRGSAAAGARAATWRAVSGGARGLAISLAIAGAVALLAFDAAFEVFHRLFFGAGTYTFDPRTDHLVQLFPEHFWSDTAIAVGAVAIVMALFTAWQARRRAAR